MKLVVQRVTQASVVAEGKKVGAIGKGAVVLVGFRKGDSQDLIARSVEKLIHLRIFSDEQGKMNRSVLDCGYELLIVSQFTLYADISSSRRPSFTQALEKNSAEEMYKDFIEALREKAIKVETGTFGADMAVTLTNDGPVTLVIEL